MTDSPLANIDPMLVVEDNPEDFECLERTLRKSGLANPIYHCEDGEQALDFLYHRGDYGNHDAAPRPSLILLDLNLPGTDGRDVLAKVKSDESLKTIPVIVLTSSRDVVDISKCYGLGANSYVQKPVTFAGFTQALERLADYWFGLVILPREP